MSDKTPHVSRRMERPRALSKPLGAVICGCAGIAFSAISTIAAVAADGAAIPITSINVDAQRQLVVKFDNRSGSFPTVPHLLDLPGPNHRVVVDFSGAMIEKGSVQPVAELSAAVAKVLPACKALRYSNLTNTAKPTARIVLDLPEAMHADPRVVKLEEGTVTIDLGDDVASAQTAPEAMVAQTPEAAAAAEPVATAAGETTAANQPATEGAPVPTAEAPAAAPEIASAAPQAKGANGSWDWSGSAANAMPTPAENPAPATAPEQPAVPATAAAADSVDGVAPGAAPTQVAAQPVSNAELRPAIADQAVPTANAAIDTSDQPLSSAPPATPAVAAPAPQASQASAQAALRLYNSAVKSHLSGKLNDAIADYKGAIAANQQFSEAHSNLGLIYNQQHDYAGALSEFRKALAINPKDAITYNGIGAALRAERDLPGAIKNWQTAVSLDPRLATAHYNLGTAYELQKDYDRALDSYQEAVKNDYRLGEAYYRMGLIKMIRKHQPDEAAAQFKEALKISGDAEYAEDARQKLAILTKTTASAGTTK